MPGGAVPLGDLLTEAGHAVVHRLFVGMEGRDDVTALAAYEVGVALLPVFVDVDLDGERRVDLVQDVHLVVEGVDGVRLRVRLGAQPAHPVGAVQRVGVLQEHHFHIWDHPHLMSAKFSPILTPPALVCIWM